MRVEYFANYIVVMTKKLMDFAFFGDGSWEDYRYMYR
jgi:hypothetical protein